jgi:hypothetical protein
MQPTEKNDPGKWQDIVNKSFLCEFGHSKPTWFILLGNQKHLCGNFLPTNPISQNI